MIGSELNITKPSLAAVNYSSARGYQQSALAQTMENLPLNSNFPIYNWLLNKRLNHVNFQRQKTKPEQGKGF
ncbi:hypothetical protein [Vibrio parahaemolyticus]|uniref:hypothetical protein n=1 Tax=Vibrio parahaemolyticus TaxID=670 RepID=UPI001F4EEC0C|nr:hypothetical protein [Vibrio parahaemolyticus]MEA5374384.1 hypothetical protein [Vibrio parahaemolyticus]HCG8611335.1 hypothetical protein [Vibrio parahaemolyticus]